MNKLMFSAFEPLDYACTEALNTLCTNLSFAGNGITKMMVTSCQSGEGKSFLAMNMMRTMAELGKSVVLVDADLRRSFISSKFGMQPLQVFGLTHFLAGMSNAEGILYQTQIEGACMVPVGRTVANSLSLLSTPRLTWLLDWLAKQFDVVLVDAPPVGTIIDAAEIAKSCDGTLLVVSWNKVSRRELSDSKRQIERAGCRVLGTVLNNVSFDSLSSKKYYNRYYYSNFEGSDNVLNNKRQKA